MRATETRYKDEMQISIRNICVFSREITVFDYHRCGDYRAEWSIRWILCIQEIDRHIFFFFWQNRRKSCRVNWCRRTHIDTINQSIECDLICKINNTNKHTDLSAAEMYDVRQCCCQTTIIFVHQLVCCISTRQSAAIVNWCRRQIHTRWTRLHISSILYVHLVCIHTSERYEW